MVDLIEAYRRTLFQVAGFGKPFTLQVGRRSVELEALHGNHGVSSSAFLTAWNPGSVLRAGRENREAQSQMEMMLRAKGYDVLPGFGSDPDGQWPGEESVLVLGIGKAEAEDVGRAFEQAAILWMAETAIPELVVLGES